MMFNHQIIYFIEDLLIEDGQSIYDIAHKYNFSHKKLRYEINQVNITLKRVNAPSFNLIEGKLVIPKYFKSEWPSIKRSLSRKEVFIRDERLYVMILYIFIRSEQVSGHHFQDLLQLSKNSVLEEVKKLKIYVKEYRLEFQYSRKMGYHFVGEEIQIRQLIEGSINKLLQLSTGEWALKLVFTMWSKELNTEVINQKLRFLSNSLRVNFVEERLSEIIYMLAFLREQEISEVLIYPDMIINEIKSQPLYQVGRVIAREFIKEKNCHESVYITIRLLGALQNNFYLIDNCGLSDINNQVIQRVQALLGIEFQSLPSLKESLFEHLVPAYFRIVYDIKLENPYTEQIKNQYGELFYLVEKGLEPFSNFLGKKIPENEVAYFAIHFGGQIENFKTDRQQLRALVICSSGISSSLILTSNLKEIFPMIVFHRIHQMDLVKEIALEDYDMIFSTIYYPTIKKIYITKPILNPVEVQVLKSKVFRDFDLSEYVHDLSVYDILEVVTKHTDIKNKKMLAEELAMRMFGINLSLNKGGKTLMELLKKEFIQLVDRRCSWEEAITIATEPLLAGGYVIYDYVEAMIANVKKTGAYIVLSPKVAVAHARPEQGVKQLGISLLHSSQPIDFNLNGELNTDYMVQLIFVLAAVDNVSHLRALNQLSQILEERSTINELIQARSIDQLYKILF